MAGRPRKRLAQEAEGNADELLEELEIRSAPIPVEQIAETLGAKVSFEPFSGNVSGMLHQDGGRITIGVNSNQTPRRQRFTIAHEIGHLRMHKETMIIDKVVRIDYRDETSSQAVDNKEIQANSFAAELLMPRSLLVEEVNKWAASHSSVDYEQLADDLSEVFLVSQTAMNYRLTNLGIRQTF
jgi:Zn-dependent peptidase ImmA (M78 family)